MRLVYTEHPDIEVEIGDLPKTFRGEQVEVLDVIVPNKPESTGRVRVRHIDNDWEQEYFPGVIGAEWIEREDQ